MCGGHNYLHRWGRGGDGPPFVRRVLSPLGTPPPLHALLPLRECRQAIIARAGCEPLTDADRARLKVSVVGVCVGGCVHARARVRAARL